MQPVEKKKTFTTKILLTVVVIVLLSGGSMGVFGYLLNRNAVINDYGRQAMTMAQTAAESIDEELFIRAAATGESDEYWKEIKDYLDKIRTETRALWVYIVLPSGSESNVKVFAEGDDLRGELPVSDDYGTVLSASAYPEEMTLTLRTGSSTCSGIFDGGEFGRTVGGYAAIGGVSGTSWVSFV